MKIGPVILMIGMCVAAEARMETYTVRPGDTLQTIRGKYAPTLEEIIQANGSGFDPLRLREGQEIRIPSGSYFDVLRLESVRAALEKRVSSLAARSSLLGRKLERYRVYAAESTERADALAAQVARLRVAFWTMCLFGILLVLCIVHIISQRRVMAQLAKGRASAEASLRELQAQERSAAVAVQRGEINAARDARERVITAIEKMPPGVTRDDVVRSLCGGVSSLTERKRQRS